MACVDMNEYRMMGESLCDTTLPHHTPNRCTIGIKVRNIHGCIMRESLGTPQHKVGIGVAIMIEGVMKSVNH